MKIGRHKVPATAFVHLAAGALALGLTVFVARDFLIPAASEPCGDLYSEGTMFGVLTKSGEPISGADLQSRLAGRDVGVLENANGVRLHSGAPAQTGLRVKLAALPNVESTNDTPRANGVGFNWVPRRLQKTDVTCLTYAVRFAPGMKLGHGGVLPGLIGGRDSIEPSFSTRIRWNRDGRFDLRLQSEDPDRSLSLAISHDRLRLEPGQWTRVDQQVVLNRPGQADGIVRVWFDGNLMLEKRGMVVRRKPDSHVLGVGSTVAYTGREVPKAADGSDAVVDVTPYVVRWPSLEQ